jgi:hypothetical protein
MAYSLRYWYNNKLTDGKVIRLEIYKKDSTTAAMEIGDVVQGISLNIDGGEDNIDAPIVSTSLVMTFCDAYDHPEADVKKCGNYAEFYTPDATLWKVVLLCKDKGSSSFRTLRGGYVTPDSYEEVLQYRGSITIKFAIQKQFRQPLTGRNNLRLRHCPFLLSDLFPQCYLIHGNPPYISRLALF